MVCAAVAVCGSVAGASAIGGATGDEPAERVAAHPRTFSLVATGDWLPEARVNRAAAAAASGDVRFDHAAVLAPVGSIIRSADLAICHMEVPIDEPGGAFGFVGRSPAGYSLIAAPYEVAADLRRAGFDRCSTASNHSYDLGVAGIDSTLVAFDAAGITHTGTARAPSEAAVGVFEVEGVSVAHLSYARNSNTGWPSEDWRFRRLRSPDTVIDDVAAARALGAEVVIVSIHVFIEMRSEPDAADRAIVEAITAAGGVDLVVIHGPHVVQPVEVVNGAAVFWSLGNFVSGMGVPGRGRYSDLRALDGLMASARFVERDDGSFSAVVDPILLCQRTTTRVVYQGIVERARTDLPDDIRRDVDACIARSAPVVAGLR